MDFELPAGIKESELTPDPAKRPGHWIHEPTDTVIACPVEWKPKTSKKPAAPKVEETAPEVESPVEENE